jgi:MHS family proline/betaine transporter-like MFS transporter
MSTGSWFFAGFDFILISSLAFEYGVLFSPNPNPTSTILFVYGTLSLSLLGRVLGGIVFSRLSDRHGRRPVILTTSILLSLTMFIFAINLYFFYTHTIDLKLNSMMDLVIISPVIFVVLRMIIGFLIGGIWPTAGTLAIENIYQDYKYEYGLSAREISNENRVRKQRSLKYIDKIGHFSKEEFYVLQYINEIERELEKLALFI